MRLKNIAAAIALAAVPLAGLATAGTASAATPSCGSSCIDVFSKNFGSFSHPQFVMDVYKQSQAAGTPVILFRTSNADPAEDFTVASEGTVHDFFLAGLVSSALALHYGGGAGTAVNPLVPDLYAFEAEYAPYGAETGLCAGVATTAVNGTKVSLQSCGVSARTVWIVDTADSCPRNPLYYGEAPLVNGSDGNFSHPYVLTYPGASYPTDQPRPQLYTAALTGFSQSGNGLACGQGSITGVNSNQLWAADAGVLP